MAANTGAVAAGDLAVLGWKVWYDDGRVLSSRQMTWTELPADGVLVVMVYLSLNDGQGRPTRRMMSGYDYYFQQETTTDPICGGLNDSPPEIHARYPGAVILRGKWTTDERLKTVIAQALQDYDIAG